MVCKHCGQPLDEGALNCSQCGMGVQDASVIVEEAATDVVLSQAGDFVEVSYEEVLAISRKRKGKIVLAACLAAIAVIAAVAVVLNLAFLSGLWVKTFGTDQEYLSYVETKEWNAYVDVFSEICGAVKEQDLGAVKQGVTLSASPQLSDNALSMLQQLLGTEENLSFLNTLSLKLGMDTNEEWNGVSAGLLLADTSVISVDMLMNTVAKELFLGVPEWNGVYWDLSASLKEENGSLELSGEEILEIVQEILPEEKVVNELLKKYIAMVYDTITEVSVKEETVTVNGIAQNVTVLEYAITEETATNIAAAVLTAAKTDEEIKEILQRAETVIEEKKVADFGEEALYDQFVKAVDELLDSLSARDAVSGETVLVRTYVNGIHEIVGRAVEVNGEEVFRCVSVSKGSQFAAELVIQDGVTIRGGGSVEKMRTNAEFSLETVEKLGTIVLKDIDCKALKDGYLNGTVRLVPSEKLHSMIFEQTSFADKKMTLDLVFSGAENTATVAVQLMENEQVFAGITLTETVGDPKPMARPTQIIDPINDTTALENWLENADTQSIVNKLKDKNVPDSLVRLVEGLLENLKSAYGPTVAPEHDNAFTDSDDFDYGDDFDYSDDFDYNVA